MGHSSWQGQSVGPTPQTYSSPSGLCLCQWHPDPRLLLNPGRSASGPPHIRHTSNSRSANCTAVQAKHTLLFSILFLGRFGEILHFSCRILCWNQTAKTVSFWQFRFRFCALFTPIKVKGTWVEIFPRTQIDWNFPSTKTGLLFASAKNQKRRKTSICLFIKGEELDVHLARGLVDGGWFPVHLAAGIQSGLGHQSHFIIAVRTATWGSIVHNTYKKILESMPGTFQNRKTRFFSLEEPKRVSYLPPICRTWKAKKFCFSNKQFQVSFCTFLPCPYGDGGQFGSSLFSLESGSLEWVTLIADIEEKPRYNIVTTSNTLQWEIPSLDSKEDRKTVQKKCTNCLMQSPSQEYKSESIFLHFRSDLYSVHSIKEGSFNNGNIRMSLHVSYLSGPPNMNQNQQWILEGKSIA